MGIIVEEMYYIRIYTVKHTIKYKIWVVYNVFYKQNIIIYLKITKK